jgi:DNA primase
MRDVEREVPIEKKPRGKLVLPKGIIPLKTTHKNYLTNIRKFKVDELERLWEIKGMGIHASMPWRIFIPVFYLGTMVSYTTRTIRDDTERRYWSADPEHEAISHKELLYGEDYCRNTVVVCEGPTDVWRIGPGAVCTFGTTFTGAQVEKISKYPRRVICFDDESESQRQANELCSALEVFSGETVNIVLEGGKDPDSSRSEAKQIRQQFLEDQ